jgi:hypothetical protein
MRSGRVIVVAALAAASLGTATAAHAANHPRLAVGVSRSLHRLIVRLGVEAGGVSVASPPRSIALSLPSGFGINGGRFAFCRRASGTGRGACRSRNLVGSGSALFEGYNSASSTKRIEAPASVDAYNGPGSRILLRFTFNRPVSDQLVLTGTAAGRGVFISLPSLEMLGYTMTLSSLRLVTRPGWVRIGGCPPGGAWGFGARYAYYSRSDRPAGPPNGVGRRVRCGPRRRR